MKYYALLPYALAIGSCFARQPLIRILDINQAKADTHPSTKATPTITVWIHGSHIMPRSEFTNCFHGRCCLKSAYTLPKRTRLHRIAHVLANQATYPNHMLYFFGWPGTLSFSVRKQAAGYLYAQLKEAIIQWRNALGLRPALRIITHSHGGNVALNLALYAAIDSVPLVIEELIMLACPVQEATKKLIEHPMFKRVYALYSTLDIMQVLDPQGLYGNTKGAPLFSQRCFNHHPKLMQAKIQVNKRSITHEEFIASSFLANLGIIIRDLHLWACQDQVKENHYGQSRLLRIQCNHSLPFFP